MIDVLSPECSVRQNKKGDSVAPHKPLLLLLALARLQRGEPRLMTYQELERDLKDLLSKYSNKTRSLHPEYPFWRLRNDCEGKLWDIPNAELVKPNSSGDVSASQLVTGNIKAGFAIDVYDAFKDQPKLAAGFAQRILDESFPESLHEDIRGDIALVATWYEEAVRRKRDPSFARNVLESYRYSCAICHYGSRIDKLLVGVEAAHIKWHCYNGPDECRNGIAMCSLHHKAFDNGGLALSDDGSILVAKSIHGPGAEEAFFRYGGRQIFMPIDPQDRPHLEFVRWHRKEIYRGTSQ